MNREWDRRNVHGGYACVHEVGAAPMHAVIIQRLGTIHQAERLVECVEGSSQRGEACRAGAPRGRDIGERTYIICTVRVRMSHLEGTRARARKAPAQREI